MAGKPRQTANSHSVCSRAAHISPPVFSLPIDHHRAPPKAASPTWSQLRSPSHAPSALDARRGWSVPCAKKCCTAVQHARQQTCWSTPSFGHPMRRMLTPKQRVLQIPVQVHGEDSQPAVSLRRVPKRSLGDEPNM
jgi:hypothetical protein